MPRTIVYPAPAGIPGPARVAAPPAPANADEYGDKLVKYLPAEVVAFYVPAYALIQEALTKDGATGGDWARWVILAVGVLGTVGYLFVRADQAAPPRLYFYALAAVAFLGWAFGTSTVGNDLFSLAEWVSKFVLLIVVFGVPLVDEVLTRLWP